jgi:hypothetical protein
VGDIPIMIVVEGFTGRAVNLAATKNRRLKDSSQDSS